MSDLDKYTLSLPRGRSVKLVDDNFNVVAEFEDWEAFRDFIRELLKFCVILSKYKDKIKIYKNEGGDE